MEVGRERLACVRASIILDHSQVRAQMDNFDCNIIHLLLNSFFPCICIFEASIILGRSQVRDQTDNFDCNIILLLLYFSNMVNWIYPKLCTVLLTT